MSLVPVKNYSWVLRGKPYVGRYKNEEGDGLSGFYFRDYKRMRHSISLYNGNFQTRYRYPKVDIPFSSPMHRWDNLYFCGGYGATNPDGTPFDTAERLVQYVVTGRKPMGFIVVEEKDKDKYIDMVGDSVDYKVLPHWLDNHCEIGFANRGLLGDLFDVDGMVESYMLLNQMTFSNITELDLKLFGGIKKKRLQDFFDYDYAHPRTTVDELTVGCILGYPLESTFAFSNDLR